MMRETCQVWVGGLDDYRQCDASAVDYYMGDDGTVLGRKFWLCAYHWDIHAKAIARMEADADLVSRQ